MNEYKFWLVWNPVGSPPMHRHPTKEAAEREAERLAIKQPGHAFYVLAAFKVCQHSAVHWTTLRPEPDQEPF